MIQKNLYEGSDSSGKISLKKLVKSLSIILFLNIIVKTYSQENSQKFQEEKEDESENVEIKLPTHLDEEEYKLVQINNENFKEMSTKIDHFFLFIHNPWCKFSQKMEEKLFNIHKILKLEPQPYFIGALDSSIINSNEFLDKFIPDDLLHVPRIYPKFIYFYKGVPKEVYNERHNRDAILNYIKRKLYPESIKLPIVSIFDYKIIHDKNAFIFVNPSMNNDTLSHAEKLVNKEALELFNKFAMKDKNVMFYHTFDSKIVDYLFEKNSTFSNRTIHQRNLNMLYFSKGKLIDVYLNEKLKVFFERSVNYFINKQVYKSFYNKFNEEAINDIFMKKQSAFILFRNKFDNSTDYLEQNLPLLASQESGIKFIVTDIAGKFELKLAKLLLITNKNLPSIRMIDFSGGFRRYEYEGDFSIENVMQFIKNWKKGQYKPYYSSQLATEESGKKKEILRKIGSANFYESVIVNKRNVMVLFYTSWCGHCKKIFPVLENLQKKMNNEIFTIVMIDVEENDIPVFDTKRVPLMKLYTIRDKQNPIIFDQDISFKNLLNFVETNLSIKKDL